MTEKFQIEVLAEIVAINQTLGQILVLLGKSSDEPDRFFREQLENGVRAIEGMPLWGGTPEQLNNAREQAVSRFSDLMTTAAKNAGK